MTSPRVHARSRAHAARPDREAPRPRWPPPGSTRCAVRAEQRVVRDRRPGAGVRSRTRRRGGERLPWSSATIRGRTSTPSFPKARRRSCPTTTSTPRSRSRPPTARRELVAMLPSGRLAIDDAPFPLWEALAGRDAASTQRRARRRPSSRRRSTSSSASARRRRSTSGRCARCAPPRGPGALATDLSGAFLRAVAELGATANTVDPVFQVMPRVDRRRPVQRDRRSRVPAPDAPARARGRRRAVDRHRHQPPRLRVRFRRERGSSAASPTTIARAQFDAGARSSTACSRSPKPGATGADLVRAPPASATVAGRGSRTSTSRTASAPTAPRCRSSAPTSATSSTRRSCCSPAWCSCSNR